MKLLTICLASSVTRVLAKLIHEAIKAAKEHHLRRIISPHILNNIPKTFIYSGNESSADTGADCGSTGLNLEI